MQIKFTPYYRITSKIATDLIRTESAKQKILHLSLTPAVLASLRETARLYTTHYSTMIEGNRLGPNEIETVLKQKGHFPGREREEHEVKGYYAALTKVEQLAAAGSSVREKIIQTLHALVIGNGKTKVMPTPYRDGQHVIRDGVTRSIVYGPPEAKDTSILMQAMVDWINDSFTIPCPIVAGIVHYQFATIHPYYDSNGRTARLLTTLILHLGKYDLKRLYSLEEYYARNLAAYYNAISVGESHNYYEGRAEADITEWIEYFVEGVATSFENVLIRLKEAEKKGSKDQSSLMCELDARQRKVLTLFQEFEVITSRQIGELFGFKPRTSAQICSRWTAAGFLNMIDSSNRGREYKLAEKYALLVSLN